MVAFLNVNKKGEVTGAGVEAADEALKKAGVTECILEAASTISLPGKGSIGTVSYSLAMSPK